MLVLYVNATQGSVYLCGPVIICFLRAPVEMLCHARPAFAPTVWRGAHVALCETPREAHTCSLLLVCVCTLQCVPSVATRVVAKISRDHFSTGATAGRPSGLHPIRLAWWHPLIPG